MEIPKPQKQIYRMKGRHRLFVRWYIRIEVNFEKERVGRKALDSNHQERNFVN